MHLQETLFKLRHIFFPWLLLYVGLIIGYSLFRWIFEIQLGLSPLQDKVVEILLPILLVVAGVYLFVVPRLLLLDFNVRMPWVLSDNRLSLYFFVMCAATGVPFLLCQFWFSMAAYNLTRVSDAADVRLHPGQKYFAIDEYQCDKQANRKLLTTDVSIGRNRKWFVEYCIVSPFSRADSIWFGLHYKRSTRYSADADFKANIRNQLVENTQREFDTLEAADIRYFERLFNSEIREEMFNTIHWGQPSIQLENQIFLLPHRTEFGERLGNSYVYMWISMAIGACLALLTCLNPTLRDENQSGAKLYHSGLWRHLELAVRFVVLDRHVRATTVLALLHILVFCGLLIAGISPVLPTQSQLISLGGNYAPAVVSGQFWRLATSLFVHGGLLHFCLNLGTLIVIGGFLERILGSVRLLIVYLIGGLAASLAAHFVLTDTAMVGAPGAIFALLGAALCLTACRAFKEDAAEFALVAVAVFGLAGCVFCIGIGAVDISSNAGGLIAGALAGGVFAILDKQPLTRRAKRV